MSNLLEKIINLNSELSKIEIDGHGVNSLLNTFFLINYINRHDRFSLIKTATNLFANWKYRIKLKIKPLSYFKLQEELPLLTFISERRHILEMNKEILEALNGRANLFYLYKPSELLKNSGHIIWKHDIIWKLDKSKYARAVNESKKIFRLFLVKNKLSKLRMIDFSIHLKRQLMLLDFFKCLFEKNKVKYLITEHDLYNEISPLIIAAKFRKIPTFTQVHGLLNMPFAYTPILADKVFCWGEYQKDRLLDWGVPENNINVTGACQMNKILPNIKIELIPENLIIKGEKLIILATNPINEVKRIGLVEEFKKCINNLPLDWVGIIRIHPSENKNVYSNIIADHLRLFVFGNDSFGYNEVMNTAKHVVVLNSAFALDAIFHDVPISQLRIDEEEVGEVFKFVEMGVIPSFTSGERLASFVKEFEEKEEVKKHWENKWRNFSRKYCIAFGDKAAKNMIRAIKTVVNEEHDKKLDFQHH